MPGIHWRRIRPSILLIAMAWMGCSGPDGGAVLDGPGEGLDGSWVYTVNNAYDATFTGCTGDSTVLEGRSFVEGLADAPICIVSGRFELLQNGDTLSVLPQTVTCSDGSTATVAGVGTVADGVIHGVWESASDRGVVASQTFSGTMVGNTLAIVESERAFSSGFLGSCSFSPPLTATATLL